MRLLYWYTRFLDKKGNSRKYHGLYEFELNLSNNMKYHYDVNTCTFSHEKHDTPLSENFWGNEPLYNINAIVGQNGEGKTTVIHTVIDTLQEIFDCNLKSPNETIFLAEIEGEKFLIHLLGSICSPQKIISEFDVLNLCPGKIESDRIEIELFIDSIQRTKIIYITNTLNNSDDERACLANKRIHNRYNFIYDCSLCGSIRHTITDDCYSDLSLGNRKNASSDILKLYFVSDYYKQINFVCNKSQQSILSIMKKQGLSVSIPKQLFIKIRALNQKYNKLLLDFINVIKTKGSITEKIAYSFCTSCFFTFLEHLNGIESTVSFTDKVPKSVSANEFEDVFSLLDDWSLLIPEYFECKRKCIDFITFICNSKKQIGQFHCSESDIMALDEISPVTLMLPMNSSNTTWMVNFMEYYRNTCSPYYFLDFSWGLSSGENNLLRLFSSLFYTYNFKMSGVYNKPTENTKLICDSIIVFLDEADLTYHPEWQRQLIQIITAFLPLEFNSSVVDNLQVVLTTHSPLLLGDFPSNNVTYLCKDDNKKKNVAKFSTFGQNIHSILKDNFYLSSTIGAFASDKINTTAIKLRDKEHLTIEELNDCRSIIDLVAPGILKNKLKELFESAIINDDVILKEQLRGYVNELSTQQLKSIVNELSIEIERRNE